MKTAVYALLFLAFFCNTLLAQEGRFPLEVKDSHLFSKWTLNDSVEANVFLDNGFPKIVFDETFVKKHLQALDLKLIEAPENTYVALWGENKQHKVAYLIDDSIVANGVQLRVEALVVDFSAVKSKTWSACDIVYPIQQLKGCVELNVKDGYMQLLSDAAHLPSGFYSYDMKTYSGTNGSYITTSLQVFDAQGGKEELPGNFLLDLGTGNVVFLNKNIPEVAAFVAQSDRMHLKDTTYFKPNSAMDLTIIMPNRMQLGNIEIRGSYVPAMKLRQSNHTNMFSGTIGTQFFDKFIAVFDFGSSKLYLKPNSDKVKMVSDK